MRKLALLFVTLGFVLGFALQAHANPALHGTWSAAVDGQPLTVTFNPGGDGKVNGQPMKWQTLGPMLFVQPQGGNSTAYGFSVQDRKLSVSGGTLPGTVVMTPGTKAADLARANAAKQPKVASAGQGTAVSSNGQELAGKWCKVTNFSGNAGSTSRSECFVLNANGTYTYAYEGSMSVQSGSTASQSGDSGRWSVNGNQLTAQSRSGKTYNYTLEKRNHPKNKGDPMICLNGQCYVTFFNKPAW